MSEEEKPKKRGGTLKNACIAAIISSLMLTGVTLGIGYYMYSQFLKPTLEEAGIDFKFSDIPGLIAKYQDLIDFMKEYEELKEKYVDNQNWEDLDELNRKYEEHKDEIEQLELIMETYDIKLE